MPAIATGRAASTSATPCETQMMRLATRLTTAASLLMVAATTGMVAVSVLLTIFAGPLYEYSTRAGERLMEPGLMVEEIFGADHSDMLGGGSGTTELEDYDPESARGGERG